VDAGGGSGGATGPGSGGTSAGSGGTIVPGGDAGDGPADRGPLEPDGAFINPPDRGMTTPWVEHQAEDAETNATIIGPSRIKWDSAHIEAEAIGRKAVRLDKTGDHVAFKTTKAANSIVVRFSIPDAPGGGGIDATLGLYVNGTRVRSLALTSRYSWAYSGGTAGSTGLDTPGVTPHAFFDEVRALLDPFPAGAEVKLQRDAQDTAAFYVIDLVDFEQVAPPAAMPAGFTSIADFGVVPGDGKDHALDIARAMSTAKKLWFPAGTYLVQSTPMNKNGLENPGMEVRGAGAWHTTFSGAKAIFLCAGATARCVFGDFSVFGESRARDESVKGLQKAFTGPMGSGSLIENIWVEHEVVAIWVGTDPPYQTAPTLNLTVRNCRLRDLYADGINLDNGTSNSLVENCHIRNTGDDGAVVWSLKWTDWVKDKTYALGDSFISPEGKNQPDQGIGHGNTFRKLTVQMPWRANCFAAYGGADNHFEDSLCEDVLTYPGILISNDYSCYAFGPQVTTFRNISLIRAGGPMFREDTGMPWEHGALKFYMKEGSINNILVENIDIIAPTYAGIEFRGFGAAFVLPGVRIAPDILAEAQIATLGNVTLRNISVVNPGSYGIQVADGGGRGSVSFQDVVVRGAGKGGLDASTAPATFFNRVSGNQGW
jgi:hypothetical protein